MLICIQNFRGDVKGMYAVHLIYNGKILKAQVVNAKAEYVELQVSDQEHFELGDYISFLDLNRKLEMRIIHVEGTTLALYPSNSDIFMINNNPNAQAASNDERRKYIRFNVDTPAQMKSHAEDFEVRVVDISRQGIGFISNRSDLTQNMEFDVYLECNGKTVHSKVAVRNRIAMERETRYGAEFLSIDNDDLHTIRYFIVTQQLKMMS